MNTTKRIAIFIILLVVMFWPSNASARQISSPVLDDKVVFGGKYTLGSGEVLEGSLVVFGGNVLLEEGSLMEGDLIAFGGNVWGSGEIRGSLVFFGMHGEFSDTSMVGGDLIGFGGNLQLDGEVDGTVSVFGGSVGLGSTATVEGDLITPGTNLDRAEGSTVLGEVITESGSVRVDVPPVPPVPKIPLPFEGRPEISGRISPYYSLASFVFLLFKAFAFSALALLIVLFLPKNTQLTANAVAKDPVISGGLGLLTLLALPILLFILGITIILIPLSFLGAVLFVAAIAFGLIGVGLEVGNRLAEAFKQNWTPPLAAGIGTFGMTLVLGLVGEATSCISGLVWVVLGAMGLGSVLLTRFGAREYVGARAVVEVPVADEAALVPDTEEKPKPRRKSSKKTE